MKGQKKKQNGITLIALVISIIVMLILAGVSINALMGDNGILKQAQYASFMSEMAAVEEAVQLWGAEHYDDENHSIPAKGLVPKTEIVDSERLGGEIGFYRAWSRTNSMPNTSVTTDADSFNDIYMAELVEFPKGMADLYYLDNDGLNLDSNKKYIIDAENSTIYSVRGISLNGVRCYSLAMVKAVMNGIYDVPAFASAEVSGDGSNIVYAGSKYLMDKDGHYVDAEGNLLAEGEELVENPYGFEIIATGTCENIYKLYNNGDLYGKGLKGIDLGNTAEELNAIDESKWQEWQVPMPNATQSFMGSCGALYFVDSNGDLWVYGDDNTNDNKFGLTELQNSEYTGRELTKINLNGKKVNKVFSGQNVTFIATTDNTLWAAGSNKSGELGIGTNEDTEEFKQVLNITNSDEIVGLWAWGGKCSIIKFSDNSFYFSGTNAVGKNWFGVNEDNTKEDCSYVFKRIWNTVYSTDETTGEETYLQDKIDKISLGSYYCYLVIDGALYYSSRGNIYPVANITGTVVDIQCSAYESFVLLVEDEDGVGTLWSCSNDTGYAGTIRIGKGQGVFAQLTPSTGISNVDFKEIYSVLYGTYALGEDNKVYYIGSISKSGIGVKTGMTETFIDTGLTGVDTLYSDEFFYNDSNMKSIVAVEKGGKLYSTGDKTLLFGDKIIEKNWKKVTEEKVKYFEPSVPGFITTDGRLFMAGDSRIMGLGETGTINSKDYTYVKSYKEITDSNIQYKAKELHGANDHAYVLLDNGDLYATGLYTMNGRGASNWPGWTPQEDKYTWVKLFSGVTKFVSFRNGGYSKLAIFSDGNAAGWGENEYSGVGTTGRWSATPLDFTLPDGITTVDKAGWRGWLSSWIIAKGNLYLAGNYPHNDHYAGGWTKTGPFGKYEHKNLKLDEDETIVDFTTCGLDGNNCLIVTSAGVLYGWGNTNQIGLGRNVSTRVETQKITAIDNVAQAVGGSNWFVVVKKDGTVWRNRNKSVWCFRTLERC